MASRSKPAPKTIFALLASMQLSDKKVLLLVTRDENTCCLSARNIPKVGRAQRVADRHRGRAQVREHRLHARAWDEMTLALKAGEQQRGEQ
jgi:hypothetical protein